LTPTLFPGLNRRRFLKLTGATSLLMATGIIGCSKSGQPTPDADSNVDYYTCTMHPSVHLHDPKGKCPICGMNLVPVQKQGSSAPASTREVAGGGPAGFTVPVERQQQIGVTYATVARTALKREVRAVGIVTPDKARHWEFVARVDGYVQTLHVTSPGELVEKDQPLLTLYSPDLLAAERELVELLRMRDAARSAEGRRTAEELIDSARRRLVQWDVTPAQIADLERTRRPGEFLTLLSPFRGIVEAVPVDQGRNVKVGDHLVDVADLSAVWVWADVYENELAMVRVGQAATLSTAAYPGQEFKGKVSLVNPFLDAAQRTGKVRIDIPNGDFKLRPAMYVDVVLAADEVRAALTVPVGAVLPTGTRNLVFVDKTQGRLEPRSIEVGGRYGDRYEVTAGLSEGERVVASANFLIDAEAKVQGALKAFEEPVPASGDRPEARQ
jgi:Cu(I)/Ag(I) efflux system membrane fusion protein